MNVGLVFLKSIKMNVFTKLSKTATLAFSQKYLLYTNIAISITLSGTGDVLEQHYEILTDQLGQWDKTRTRNMSCSGASVGLICHFWYRYLDRMVPGRTLRIVLKKILVDQLVGSPLCISAFFLSVGVIEGTSASDLVQEIRTKFLKLYYAEWMIWPPAQFFNFYYLNPKYRVLFDNTISLGYDVYTSKVKNSANS